MSAALRLRTKFFLITASATVLPIVAATVVARGFVERNSRAGFEQLLRDGEQEVRAQYARLRRDVELVVKGLADPEDHFIGPILIALAKGGPDDEMFRQLPLTAPRVMRERGLDVLAVLGPRRVLASGHFPGRIGEAANQAPVPDGRARVVRERVLERGRPTTRVTLQAWRVARSPLGGELRVMGGRVLARGLVERLRLRGNTEVLVRDAKGRRLAQPDGGWQAFARYPQRSVPLGRGDGEPTVTVTLAVPDDRLRTALRVIDYGAMVLIACALVLALLLRAVARRITRPLEALSHGAEAVAGGDLDHRIPVRSRDEVGELVAAFNRMTEQLAESKERLVAAERVAAWREIARRIAHEIKNPLSPIQTSIETLRKVHAKGHPDFEEIFDESTTTILEEVTRLKRIVSEFSSFARMPKPTPRPFDVAEWIESTAAMYSSERVVVQCQVDAELPAVRGDRDQLTQVLVNLLANAKQALTAVAEPRLTIDARRAGEQLVVEVTDNGPGFDPDEAAHIFTPYFTTKGSGGTGLGLAICHRIVTDHGGAIEARSVPGERTTFTIRLPLAR